MNPYQTVTKDPLDKLRQGISGMAAPAQLLNMAMPGLGTAVGAGLNAVALGLPTFTNYTPINPYNTNPHGNVGYRNYGGELGTMPNPFLPAQQGDTQLSHDAFKVNGQGGIDNNYRNVQGNPAMLTKDEVVAKRQNGENYVLSNHIKHPVSGKTLAELGAKNRKKKQQAADRAKQGDSISKATVQRLDQDFEGLVQINEQALQALNQIMDQQLTQEFMYGGKLKKKNYQLGGKVEGEPVTDLEQQAILASPVQLPEATVSAKRGTAHSQFAMNSYMEPYEIRARKQFQEEYGLSQSGKLDPQTKRTLVAEGFGSREEGTSTYEQFNEAKSRRKEWQDKVRSEGKQYGYRKFTLGMDSETMEELASYNVSDRRTNQCIGGVCSFLEDVSPGTFKQAKNKKKNIYWSNSDFEANSAKEGWQMHKGTKLTAPDVGDIIKVNQRDGKHAMIITDVDTADDGQPLYRVLDNAGVGAARVRYFTLDELNKKYNKSDKESWDFFRRTQFDDLNTADLARNLPRESFPQFETGKQKFEQERFQVQAEEKLPRGARKYLEGINSIDKNNYSDIDPGHLQRIALIAASIPGNESEFGKGLRYKAETAAIKDPTKIAKGIMQTRREKTRGVEKERTFSVGLAQINPEQIPEEVKNKYFGKSSPTNIEKKLASNPELSGKVAFDIMVDRYRKFRDDPSYYAEDPNAFWYTLVKSWQSPYSAKNEKNKKAFQTLQTPEEGTNPLRYVESALNHMNKFSIQRKAMGGSLNDCPDCPKGYVLGGASELPNNNPYMPANQLPFPLGINSSVQNVPVVSAPRVVNLPDSNRPAINTYQPYPTPLNPLNPLNPTVSDASAPGLAQSNVNPLTAAWNQYKGANIWGIPGANVPGVGHPLQYYAQHVAGNQGTPTEQSSGRTGARMRPDNPATQFPFIPGVSAAQIAPQTQQGQMPQAQLPAQPQQQPAPTGTGGGRGAGAGRTTGGTNYIPGTEELKTGKPAGWKGYTTKQFQDWLVGKYGARALPKHGPDGKNGPETEGNWKQYGREFLTDMGEFGGVTPSIPGSTLPNQIDRNPQLPEDVTSHLDNPAKQNSTGMDMRQYLGDAMQMLSFAGQMGNMGAVQFESMPRMDNRQVDVAPYEEALRAARNAQMRNVGNSFTTNQAAQQATYADYMNQLTSTMQNVDTTNKQLAAQTQQYNNQATMEEQAARLQTLAAHQAAKDQVWRNFGAMGIGLNEQYSNQVGSAALASAYPEIYSGFREDITQFLRTKSLEPIEEQKTKKTKKG